MVKLPDETLIQEAARHNPLLTRQGLLERLFAYWFDSFVYNQIWEDPRVDLEALELTRESRMLTIASGGCNVLNYLIHRPARIHAVDINRHHIHFTRLKLAALERLPGYDAFFDFFGRAGGPGNVTAYREHIRPHLDAETRAYWDGGSWMRGKLAGARIEWFATNLYDHAKLGYLLRFLHRLARVTRRDPELLLRARDRAEQERIFDETIAPFFDHKLVRLVGRHALIMFSLGIPPRQFEELKREMNGDIVDLYRERVRRLACDFPVSDNYFTWQALSRRYDVERRSALPEYLKPEGYDACRRHVRRARVRVAPLTDFLRGRSGASLDRFVLLDSQDWMSAAQIAELWREIARTGRPGTRVIFRTGSSRSPVEDALPPPLRDRFVYEEERSRELHARDRAAIYGGFHLYVMRA